MIENEGSCYLYRHIRLDKNEPFYIGIGTKILNYGQTNRRIYGRAYSSSKRNNIWEKIVSKTDYEIEILLESNDYEFIKQKEIELIALYGRINLNTGILANLTKGGDSNAPIGKQQTEESKKKKSEKLKGRKLSDVQIKKNKDRRALEIIKYEEGVIGKIYKMKQGSHAKIISYKGANNVTVRFEETGSERVSRINVLKNGELKDYFYPSVQGIGYVGGEVCNKKAHCSWITLMSSIKNKYILAEEFRNFQTFTKWFEENYIEGWKLCANILDKSEKECTPLTCYYLPYDLNLLFKPAKGYNTDKNGKITAKFNNIHLGTFINKEEAIEKYKTIKKEHILKLAEKYKDILTVHVYNKILNYEVEII
jgi:hypothetical protein